VVDSSWLTLNVHHRGAEAENRLLASVASPLLLRLEGEGAVRTVWCTRFDARGPHLFFLVGTAPNARSRVADSLADAVGGHLALHPAGEPFPAAELERRHLECRGKYFTAADRLAGLAPADSWALGEPGPGDFPDPLVRGMSPENQAAFWSAGTGLFHHAVAEAAAGRATRAALAWMAAVDRALGARGLAEAAWRHHATTLVLPLAGRLQAEPEAVHAAVRAAVTPRNRALFDREWAEPDRSLESLAERMVAAASAADARAPLARLQAIRTAVHGTLLLLGLPVAVHVPLVLYAWDRSLPRAEAA
jgi:hypothetical protein